MMAVQFTSVPDKITANETIELSRSWHPVTISTDGSYLFLSLEQARSLWYELGAVLQSEDARIKEDDGATVQEMFPNA
jgi:hypothetical protein